MARKPAKAKKRAARGPATTQMVGEDMFTTMALGEEGTGLTTLRVGEEGPTTLVAHFEEGPTTLAVGEEGPTTKRVGEEGPTTILHPFEEGPTTLVVGEEGPTTQRVGEEGPPTFFLGEVEPQQAAKRKAKRKTRR